MPIWPLSHQDILGFESGRFQEFLAEHVGECTVLVNTIGLNALGMSSCSVPGWAVLFPAALSRSHIKLHSSPSKAVRCSPWVILKLTLVLNKCSSAVFLIGLPSRGFVTPP